MNIKAINRCVLYILQAREIIERRHLFSVYLVHVKLPNIPPLMVMSTYCTGPTFMGYTNVPIIKFILDMHDETL